MSAPSALDALSPRERQYVLLLALGKRRKAIAKAMKVAPSTGKCYHTRASTKLGIPGPRLAAYAIAQGWTA